MDYVEADYLHIFEERKKNISFHKSEFNCKKPTSSDFLFSFRFFGGKSFPSLEAALILSVV